MALLNRPRTAQPVVYVDVRAAEKWDRKGLLARILTSVLNQEKAAYQREQHRVWKHAGLDRVAPTGGGFNPFRMSHWLGHR